MSFLFEPVSAAIQTLKLIKGTNQRGPDPNRFVIRTPVNPGKWALGTAFKRQHNIWKWGHYLPSTVPRRQKIQQKPQGMRLRLVTHPSMSDTDTGNKLGDAPSQTTRVSPELAGTKLPKIDDKSLDGASSLPSRSKGSEGTYSSERDSRSERVSSGSSSGKDGFDEDGMPFFPIHDDEEAEHEARRIATLSPEQKVYHRSCEHFKVKPCRQMMKQIDTGEATLAYIQLRDIEFKAITTSLVMNFTVKRLDLTGVCLTLRQMTYLNDFLMDDNGITDLILKDNLLEGRMLHLMFENMRYRDVMIYLDISGNHLRDKDVVHLASYVESSSQLSYLQMAKNKLTSKSGDILGKMLANSSLIELNLSANQLRGDGMTSFLNGAARNASIERLDVSWNGIGPEAIRALCNLIKQTTTLNCLNLTATRINGECLDLMFTQGLAKNSTIQRLGLQNNPLLTTDFTTLFTRLLANSTSNIRRLDLGDYQVLDSNCEHIVEELFTEKGVDIRSGPFFAYSKKTESFDAVVERFRQDTVDLVTRLTRAQRTWLVKYFAQADMDEAIETGSDIPVTSFVGRVNDSKVTYKDLAQRVRKERGDPRDVIRDILAKQPDPESAGDVGKMVSRLTIGPEEARKLQFNKEF